MKTDKNFVLEAITYSTIPLFFLSRIGHPLAKDPDILLKASKYFANLVQNLPPEKKSKETILKFVTKNGMSLKFVNNEFQDDEEIVLQAVTQTGDAFEFASDRLKGNKTIVLVALQTARYPHSIYEQVPTKIKNDFDIVKEMIRKAEHFYRLDLPKKYKENIELGLLALEMDLSTNFEYLPRSLREDKNLILNLFKEKHEKFGSFEIEPILSNDEEFLLKLIEIHPKGFILADKNKKADLEFVEKAMSIDSGILEYGVSKDILYQIKQRKNKTNKEKLKIKVGNFTITFLEKIRKSDLKHIVNFKKNLFKAIIKINNSKVPNFSSILSGSIVTGEYHVLKKLYPATDDAIAKWTGNQIISYYGSKESNSYLTFIHELGHKYHDSLSMKTREEIENLYKKATDPRLCKMVKKPQIGEPLSNLTLNLDRWDWLAGDSEFGENYMFGFGGRNEPSTKFVFNGMRGKDFLYVNKENGKEKTISPKEFSIMSKCPSEYGATNHMEFVAEMCTLITMDIVKPQQKEIANKFIEIVKKG